MKKQDVIKYFGNQEKTALALGVKQASVSRWSEQIPKLRAFEIERITNGALKADFTPPQCRKVPKGEEPLSVQREKARLLQSTQ